MRLIECYEKSGSVFRTENAVILLWLSVINHVRRINACPTVFWKRLIIWRDFKKSGWRFKRNVLQSLYCATRRIENLRRYYEKFQVFGYIKEDLRLVIR